MTDAPGVAAPYPVAPGVAKAQQLKAGGFTDGEISQWAAGQTAKLQAGKYTDDEIKAYWGNQTPANAALSAHVATNYNAYATADPKLATSPGDAFAAGWDRSVAGLVINRHNPTSVMPANASLTSKVFNAVGQFVGDAPASVAGFFGGAAAGSAAGAAVPVGGETGVTEAIGAVGGAGFGMGATPEASRQVLMDAYNARDGRIKTWQDATHVIASSLWETAKAGITGMATNLIGGPVAGKLEALGASKLVSAGGAGAAQVVTSVATASALDGHMPDAADFTTAALLTLGLHGVTAMAAARKGGGIDKVGRVQANMETLYRETGVPPWEAAARASRDPVFKQELYGQDVNGNPVNPQFRNIAPADPEAYKPGVRETGLVPEHQTGWLQPETMRNITPAKEGPFSPPPKAEPASEGTALVTTGKDGYVQNPTAAKAMLAQLEGSGDSAVSPKGAIGKYQIMPGTARFYMGNDFDVKTLFDPKVNSAVADKIVSDLYKRYQGNMNAIAIAYNAGPGRAGQYMKAGPGTALDAVVDKTIRGGIRYESKPAARDESFLPTETQRYLANERRRTSGAGGGEGPPGAGEEPKVPSYSLATTGGGAGGGGEPPSGGPPAVGGPEEEHVKFWAKASEEAASDEMLRNIGEDPKAPSTMNMDRILGQFVSELTPARRLDDRLIKGGEMDRAKDLGAEDMFRQTYASDMRTGAFIKYGEIDPITLKLKIGTPSVMDAVKSVRDKGGDMQGFVAYMLAKRTVDKMGQDIETGFNPEAAMNLASQKGAIKKYEDGRILFNAVMDGVLRYSRDSGVHSDAQIEAMKRDNPSYISMRRIMGDDAAFTASGRGFSASDPLKRMEGSDKQIVDPVAATLDNMRLIVKMADRNRAIGHVIGMIERGEMENPGLLKIEDSQTIKAADEKAFKPYGLPPESDPNSTYAVELAERGFKGKGGPNDFMFYRDGKPELWRAKDPALAELMRKADSPGQQNIVMQTFNTFAGLERAGITVSPDFPTKVQLRHQVTAFINDPLHPPPFLTWLNGISHVIKQDDLYKKAITQGALGVSLADMDASWLARDMDKVFTETDTWGGVANAFQHPIQFAQVISERMDAAARIGYMKQAEAKGIDSIKAATMSRKAYLDYAERGTAQIANQMSSIITFFRPHLLGLKQFGEAVVERPASTAAYSVAAIALPIVALYALNTLQDQFLPEERKFANIPQWQKDSYFISPEIAGMRFRLRLPPNAGFILGGMVNRMLDQFRGVDTHAFEGWAMRWLDEYIPPMFPALTQAPIEVATNHSFFSGQQLIPGSMEKASGYMQYTAATSETGKALSRALGPPGLDVANFSPIQFDQLVKGWSGTLGADALKALDMPFSSAKKPWQLADLPFVGSFMVRHPGMTAAPVQRFYELADKIEAEHQDFALAMKRVQGSGDTRDIDLAAASGQYAQAIAPIKEAIARQSAIIQGINTNKNMTASEKRQFTDQLMPQIIETAKQGVMTMDDIGKANKATSPAGPPMAGDALPAPVAAPEAPARPPVAPAVGVNRGQVPIA